MRFDFTRVFLLGLGLLVAAFLEDATAEPTFAERLGWQPGTIAVILHVDDVGMSHASNRGAIESHERGIATSCALMMPCPWIPEMAEYLATHTNMDSGIHLTLTSEWKPYRWGPLAGKPRVPGLTDPEGCLWRSAVQVAKKASADEVEMEIRAQLERAESLHIPITHLDSHMGTLFARADFFERFARVGIEKGIPILAVGGHMTHTLIENGDAVEKLKPWIAKIWNAGLPVLDDLHTGTYSWPPGEKKQRLIELLKTLKPGVTEILFHASKMTEELPIITGSSASRQADLDALTDPEVRRVIKERGIVLTSWREIHERRKKAAPMP